MILRGITAGFGDAIPATTAIYVDDVPNGSSTANASASIATLDLDLAILQCVEVLRGPTGDTLWRQLAGRIIVPIKNVEQQFSHRIAFAKAL